MSKIIAKIKLAQGKVAFYDELTRIHLTLSHPYGDIYEGMNLKRIKASVKSGTLVVLSGSLSTPTITTIPNNKPDDIAPKAKAVEAPVIDEVTDPVVDEVAEPVTEPIAEEVISEPEVVEVKTTKRGRKKTTTESE